MNQFLHNHPEFGELIQIVSSNLEIAPILVEKDYWIMHSLYGLQNMGMRFYMKGGTSLSKGYKLIDRFSEDIDILIEPPEDMKVATGKNQDKESHRASRKKFYDWIAEQIQIDGIISVSRDESFDDEKYRSGGIRLHYSTTSSPLSDLKEGILLELGFDNVFPNQPITISSWAYDFAKDKVSILDNRAINVLCYSPEFTLVEKLQTISTKFRKQQASGMFSENFMRHYYDVYKLLENDEVIVFIGTSEYLNHKKNRFRNEDMLDIRQNPAFNLENPNIRKNYEEQYNKSQTLYFKEKPEFQAILDRIESFFDIL